MAQRTVNSMRSFLAGLIFLTVCSPALAQISGEVESIGFNSTYRPDCFVPMIVRIKPQAGMSGLYYIEVKQRDLDSDGATFRRTISITGDENAREQRFATYFLPTPTGGGLPDPTAGGTLRDLQKELKVFLTDKNGKQIASLPITSTMMNIDPPRTFGAHRGTRLVLVVCGNGSSPSHSEYDDQQNLLGVLEDVVFVQMAVRDLPENPVAYDAVDAVLWMNVDPADLKRGSEHKFRALDTFVRNGGHLVLCQSPQWQEYLEFGDLLPVTLQGVDSKKDIQPLHALSDWHGPRVVYDPKQPRKQIPPIPDPWEALPGPFTFARAQAKPNTIVDEWMQWDDEGKDRTPYIVRQLHGLGAVTWVAQDLGDPGISSRTKSGWVNIWNKVFDWKDSPLVVDKYTEEFKKDAWNRANKVDMGGSVNPATLNFTGTVSSLVALAVAFFIIYWVVAGPGIFAYLVNKRRQNLSWFGFTVSAIVATLVTVLIVKLVVRGPPEIKHATIIKQGPNQPAMVESRFGLYIKQDGPQRIELKDSAPGTIATLTALPLHPDYIKSEGDSTSAIDYTVPVRDITTEEPPAVSIYYRNTAKKFDARWSGQTGGKIDGSAKLSPNAANLVDGVLTNGTGHKLEDVYFAVKYPGSESTSTDWVLWMDSWEAGVTVDLARAFAGDKDKNDAPSMLNHHDGVQPGSGKAHRIKATLSYWEDDLWAPVLKSRAGVTGEGSLEDMRDTFVILTFFNRLQPIKNMLTDNPDRAELLRRGARHLDRSAALAAGGLVIIARSSGELPVPLEVEGEKITGEGPIYHQFVLPLDHAAFEAAATTQPEAK